MNTVIRLHLRRVPIAEIASRTAMSISDVTRIIVADRESKARPVYMPTEEEIYAEAERLREKTPRYPVGQSPQGVEVMRTTAAPMDHRYVKGTGG